MYMTKNNIFILVCSILLSNPVFADSEEEYGLDYDSIISQYSRTKEVQTAASDPFESVKFHLGVGITNTFFNVDLQSNQKLFVSQRGVQANLGVDLFSRHWTAEGTFVNYGEEVYKNAKVSLKEFDLRLIYKNLVNTGWGYRIGGGLSARYLKISQNFGLADKEYSTPSTTLLGGIEAHLNSSLSVGVEVAGRSALIDDTPEAASMDFGVRVDGHF